MARQQSKRRRAQGVKVKSASAQQPQEVKCPGKGGAKRSAGAYASDFYAGPVLPPGMRRGPQYCVTEEPDSPAGAARCGRTALFTPPQKCAVARRPEQGPRLPRLWVCVAHQHRQCASCAAVGGGCGTAAPGDMPGIRDRQCPCRAASGGHEERRPTPLGRGAHRRRRDADGSGDWTRDRAGCGHTSEEGWMRPPPPPAKRRRCTPPGAAKHGRAGTEVT